MRNIQKIAIIGGGVMGEIFITGAIDVFAGSEICVVDKNVDKLNAIKKNHPTVETVFSNLIAINNADLIIIAVKPQSFEGLARHLEGAIGSDSLVISIMAGVSIKKIQKDLGVKSVIRAMPNMGARVKKSVTTWIASEKIGAPDKDCIRKLFGGIGFEMEIDNERMIDTATAIAGSGPGFLFYLVEEWLKSAQKMGLGKEETKKMLLATIDGANTLLQQSGEPEILKQQVASKGGTTEAGLKEMKKIVPALWRQTLSAAQKRARELSK
ncbi:MAG: pyrroline-5-carboxylate reductase [Candidatus Magasanikbacteria bacterium]|jgi:pyrroline-5-carboxylate reductase